MMQFYMGDLLLLGLTKRNVEKLMNGEPIMMDFRGKEPLKNISIMFGEDKPSILKQLQESGCQIPHWMWESAQRDPL